MSSLPAYQHGHSQAILACHTTRSATNDMSFLVPHVKPGMSILDVGCGPGSITLGFAESVGPRGKVVGLDLGQRAIATANGLAKERGIENSEFLVGNVYSLPFPDESFDIVYCHQVLTHCLAKDGGPVAALKEMRRVCKAGGIVAPREGITNTGRNYPELPGLEQSMEWLVQRVYKNGGEVDPGARLHEFAEKAGFEKEKMRFKVGLSMWMTPEGGLFVPLAGRIKGWRRLLIQICVVLTERLSYGSNWTARTSEPEFLERAMEAGIENASKEEQIKMIQAWQAWTETDGAWRYAK
ncbi:hypothetical protein FRB96_004162 [Tulasnella sp. 330]|nr:hypothetical protein FRB96_004162 [Tulasnella sp. 330]